MLINFGFVVLMFAIVTYLTVATMVARHSDGNDDPQIAIMNFMNDVGLENFLKIQTILQFMPYILTGGLTILMLSFWY